MESAGAGDAISGLEASVSGGRSSICDREKTERTAPGRLFTVTLLLRDHPV